MSQDSSRNYSIDFIKFFAVFAVVCIHTQPFKDVTIWIFHGNSLFFVINTIARFAVPFFFMTSGFLFGNKISFNNNKSFYFYKYMLRLAKLYFSWMLFYFIIDCVLGFIKSIIQHTSFDLRSMFGYKTIVKLLLNIFYYGYVSDHLWYLIALLWSIIILFLFINMKKLNLLLALSFFLNMIGLFGNSYHGIIGLPVNTRDALFFGLFYCTLGCSIAFNKDHILKKISSFSASLILIFFVIFTLLQLGEHVILVQYFGGKITSDFFISTIPMTSSLFLITLKVSTIGKNSYLTTMGKNSLGIYVIHPIFIIILSRLLINVVHIKSNSVLYSLLLTPLVFFTSYFAYEWIQKFKNKLYSFGKKLISG